MAICFPRRPRRRQEQQQQQKQQQQTQQAQRLQKRTNALGKKKSHKKKNQRQREEDVVVGSGVFVSSRALDLFFRPTHQDPVASSSVTSRSSRDSSCDEGGEEETRQQPQQQYTRSTVAATTRTRTRTTTTTTTPRWKTTASSHHNNDEALLETSFHAASTTTRDHKFLATTNAQKQQQQQQRQLPGPWYFSSNHVLVNQSRSKRDLPALRRLRELDELARAHAEQMAAAQRVYHVALPTALHALPQVSIQRLGENVSKGESIRSIHKTMMKTLSERNNILDPRMTHMGMGTAIDKNGELYLCQIFRG